jgi:hypothetical protein
MEEINMPKYSQSQQSKFSARDWRFNRFPDKLLPIIGDGLGKGTNSETPEAEGWLPHDAEWGTTNHKPPK